METIMGYVRYLRLKFLTSFCRLMLRALGGTPRPKPDSVLLIPSRDRGRSIKAHVYKPAGDSGGASPHLVLVNFFGSGFAIPLHGSDDAFCRLVATQTRHVVLDVSYRLAPEYPFPAAVHDAEDALRYVLDHPAEYDAARVSVSGFSSGGTLALLAPLMFPAGTFRSLIGFYASASMATDPAKRRAPVDAGADSRRSPFWTNIFREGYLRDMDPRDPRISPLFTQDLAKYPRDVLLFTGDLDVSALELEELGTRIKDDGEATGRSTVVKRMENCKHGFDKDKKRPSHIKAREETYQLAIDLLKRVEE